MFTAGINNVMLVGSPQQFLAFWDFMNIFFCQGIKINTPPIAFQM